MKVYGNPVDFFREVVSVLGFQCSNSFSWGAAVLNAEADPGWRQTAWQLARLHVQHHQGAAFFFLVDWTG